MTNDDILQQEINAIQSRHSVSQAVPVLLPAPPFDHEKKKFHELLSLAGATNWVLAHTIYQGLNAFDADGNPLWPTRYRFTELALQALGILKRDGEVSINILANDPSVRARLKKAEDAGVIDVLAE